MSEEIRKLPAVEDRVETGPVQFGEDWPGVFIRGDNAFAYRLALSNVLKYVGAKESTQAFFDLLLLNSLVELFDNCNVNKSLVESMKKGDLYGPISSSNQG